MQFTWHIIVIIVAILLGLCLFQMGEKTPNMSAQQLVDADRYRMVAYILWAVAIVVALVYYSGENKSGEKKATMCGMPHYANMCGAPHKATMNGDTNHFTNHLFVTGDV